MLIVIQKNGKYYAEGKEYKTFKEALASIWHKR